MALLKSSYGAGESLLHPTHTSRGCNRHGPSRCFEEPVANLAVKPLITITLRPLQGDADQEASALHGFEDQTAAHLRRRGGGAEPGLTQPGPPPLPPGRESSIVTRNRTCCLRD